MVKGALHIHSTHSDGEFSLAELRELYIQAGCRYACVTDHADHFDEERVAAYRRECEALSDDWFTFIPGLEYSCVDRMHILGYGVTTLEPSTDPEVVIRHIHACGGVAVIAHPKDTALAGIEAFDELPDGVEAWNSKYDGRYAPRPAVFALLSRLRARRDNVHAFYGQDLHWRRQYRGLFTLLDTQAIDRASVLDALRRGQYTASKGALALPSDGVIDPTRLAEFERIHGRSDLLRQWIKRTKGWVSALGLRVPAPVKAELRRMF